MARLNTNEQAINIGATKALLQVAQLYGDQSDSPQLEVLREWLYKGAEDTVLQLIEQGEVSFSLGAEALDITIYDLQALIKERGIEVGQTDEQRKHLVWESYPKKPSMTEGGRPGPGRRA